MKKLLLLLLIAPFLGFGQYSYALDGTIDLGDLYISNVTHHVFTDGPLNITVPENKIISTAGSQYYEGYRVSINGSDWIDFTKRVLFFPGTQLSFSGYEGHTSGHFISLVEYSPYGSGTLDELYIKDLIFLYSENREYTVPLGHYIVTEDSAGLIINGQELSLDDVTLLPENTYIKLQDDESHFLGLLIEMYDPNSLAFNAPNQTTPTLYPNPTSSLLALNSDKEYDIEVYDMAGNKVMALTGNTIDMSHLSSATYIVKALDKVENEEVSYKVVKN